MPIYTIEDTTTGEVTEKIMTIAEKEDLLKNNPHLRQRIVKAPAVGDPWRLGRVKNPDSFKDLMREIKKKSPGSTMNTR